MNFLKNIYHLALAWVGNFLFGSPSKKLYVIGITGTKGKSTCVELVAAILEASGLRVASLSSVHVKVGPTHEKNLTGNTMPGRFFIQKFLRRAVNDRCDVAVVEVTSQGILQHRHEWIAFDAVAITGVHPEHIESHGSFENYKDSKLELFRYTAKRSPKPDKLFFINAESQYAKEFDEAAGNGHVIHYGKEEFLNRYLGGDRKKIGDWFESDFNLENAALSTEIAGSRGVNWAVIQKVLNEFRGVPGRLETISSVDIAPESPKRFSVVIDYAHTPESLEGLYRFLKGKLIAQKSGKLICVLGSAGGGRDKWKRPQMGKVAANYCDEIIITNEDPYDEPPEAIMEELASGISLKPHLKITARREAIRRALTAAEAGDIVAVTGKGSELWLHLEKGRKVPWNEREVVEECLTELGIR